MATAKRPCSSLLEHLGYMIHRPDCANFGSPDSRPVRKATPCLRSRTHAPHPRLSTHALSQTLVHPRPQWAPPLWSCISPKLRKSTVIISRSAIVSKHSPYDHIEACSDASPPVEACFDVPPIKENKHSNQTNKHSNHAYILSNKSIKQSTYCLRSNFSTSTNSLCDSGLRG